MAPKKTPTTTDPAAAGTGAGSTSGITLPQLNIGLMQVTLVGDTPLITHAWSAKAKQEMLAKQMKKATPGREAKDPQQDFMDSLYRIEGEEDAYGFPTVAFKSCAVTACTSIAGITKVAARQAFHIVGEPAMVKSVYNGELMRQDLVRIRGSAPQMREDMVRVGMGTADIRYRGQFWPWYCQVMVRFNQNVLSAEQIVNLLNTAGFGVGVGEWRAEKDGTSGLFHVASDVDLKMIAEWEAGRLQAQAA